MKGQKLTNPKPHDEEVLNQIKSHPELEISARRDSRGYRRFYYCFGTPQERLLDNSKTQRLLDTLDNLKKNNMPLKITNFLYLSNVYGNVNGPTYLGDEERYYSYIKPKKINRLSGNKFLDVLIKYSHKAERRGRVFEKCHPHLDEIMTEDDFYFDSYFVGMKKRMTVDMIRNGREFAAVGYLDSNPILEVMTTQVEPDSPYIGDIGYLRVARGLLRLDRNNPIRYLAADQKGALGLDSEDITHIYVERNKNKRLSST